ncbi:MAG: ABC transporter ATP-binding protein [Candidatus Eisenbacteria bacterium]|nr:ABC transporter ATP-binding protein [Candidatus Eisenbacteria bacterium]
MSEPPLRVRGLTRRYGELTAVDGLSLEVRAGEILGFLGPNGAGKSTTLRACAGLLRPDAGDILIAGASLAAAPLRARALMGFVPDRPFLYERLSAREFLDFVGALYGLAPDACAARAAALLARLDLVEAADDLIEGCSLGMRQKVSVAAALLHDPPLVMLDEPLQGLDPRAARALKDLLRERAAGGGGVLVSTHLLDVAERMCDRVVILHRGQKVAEGSLEELRGASGLEASGAPATLEDVFLELTREEAAEGGR